MDSYIRNHWTALLNWTHFAKTNTTMSYRMKVRYGR